VSCVGLCCVSFFFFFLLWVGVVGSCCVFYLVYSFLLFSLVGEWFLFVLVFFCGCFFFLLWVLGCLCGFCCGAFVWWCVFFFVVFCCFCLFLCPFFGGVVFFVFFFWGLLLCWGFILVFLVCFFFFIFLFFFFFFFFFFVLVFLDLSPQASWNVTFCEFQEFPPNVLWSLHDIPHLSVRSGSSILFSFQGLTLRGKLMRSTLALGHLASDLLFLVLSFPLFPYRLLFMSYAVDAHWTEPLRLGTAPPFRLAITLYGGCPLLGCFPFLLFHLPTRIFWHPSEIGRCSLPGPFPPLLRRRRDNPLIDYGSRPPSSLRTPSPFLFQPKGLSTMSFPPESFTKRFSACTWFRP